MLDAAACGKPIVVNDTVQATERFEGNGIAYKLNDLEDLVAKLATLRSAETRLSLGRYGAEKIAGTFSWRAIASRRLRDYGRAVSRGRGSVIEDHSS